MTATDVAVQDALAYEKVRPALVLASQHRLAQAFGKAALSRAEADEVRDVAFIREMRMIDFLIAGDHSDDMRDVASDAFQLFRVLPEKADPIAAAEKLVTLGCIAVVGDRAADFSRMLSNQGIPDLPLDAPDWGVRVWASLLDTWLRLMRKRGWEDFDKIQERRLAIRNAQRVREAAFLKAEAKRGETGLVWKLLASYHAMRAAEILAGFLSQGPAEYNVDICEQIALALDSANACASSSMQIDESNLLQLLARAAPMMAGNSIWPLEQSAPGTVSQLVKSLTGRSRSRPLFELLPPQRRALLEDGFMNASARSVVLGLPPASGKTLIAEMRILQALNQYESEKGWAAYLVPTRVKVNQVASRLRRDFTPLGLAVEMATPALDIDGLEAGLLQDKDPARQFRVLVTTPEKLNLLLCNGWNRKIGRPLSLVVVDEANAISCPQRGLSLELLLATIKRDCRHAQFLLLTPFLKNGKELAHWLAPESNKHLALGLKSATNERLVAVAKPQQGARRGKFNIALQPFQENRNALASPEKVTIGQSRPLGLAWSQVKRDSSMVAAATAQIMQERGSVIILTDSISGTWKIAQAFRTEGDRSANSKGILRDIQCFLGQEMGQGFPLSDLLGYGVGVHHDGMSEDARALVEWLAASGHLRVLASTSTISQGMDFPVSGIVLAGKPHHSGGYSHGQIMPPADFWNIAGRTGRAGQADVGIVALAAKDDKEQAALEHFIGATVENEHSPFVSMLDHFGGSAVQLHRLANEPGWSAFAQYLAHNYLKIGNHEKFVKEAELLLRGTFGYQVLREKHKKLARKLLQGVRSYAERLKDKPLQLVDATGLPWESASKALKHMRQERLTPEAWTTDLFNGRTDNLRHILGMMLKVPELRKPLLEAANGKNNDTGLLASIVSDWVHGRPLTEMAPEYFTHGNAPSKIAGETEPDPAMTMCCQQMFGQFTQTVSRGLAALQALTPGMDFEAMPPAEQRSLKNLPARAYYGVNSDEAVALSLLGVPRTASAPLAQELELLPEDPLSKVRSTLQGTGVSTWEKAMGENGGCYRSVWSIIGGDVSEDAELAE